MSLAEDLERVAVLASRFAEGSERLVGVLVTEPRAGERIYLCAFEAASGDTAARAWIALDYAGRTVGRRALVRDAVSIAALCEIAAETAGGGDLEELRAQLVALRLRENPAGIDEAEAAALALERAIGAPPRVASADYLDAVGFAARQLERALGDDGASPFSMAMTGAVRTVEALAAEVERGYKLPLDVAD